MTAKYDSKTSTRHSNATSIALTVIAAGISAVVLLVAWIIGRLLTIKREDEKVG